MITNHCIAFIYNLTSDNELKPMFEHANQICIEDFDWHANNEKQKFEPGTEISYDTIQQYICRLC